MKKLNFFPLFFLKSSIICVNDQADFWSSLILPLKLQSELHIVTDPSKMDSLLTKHNTLENYFLKNIIQSDPENWFDEKLNLSKIQDIHLIPDRFAQPSVVVIDYDMPKINGIDVCRMLPDISVKKIMLTGKAGNKTGVGAFNEGLIDQFIVKASSHDMINELRQAVNPPFLVQRISRNHSISLYCCGVKCPSD
ncbi:MAG: response regulator [Gammaproteobacteria bacterium]